MVAEFFIPGIEIGTGSENVEGLVEIWIALKLCSNNYHLFARSTGVP